MVRNFLLKLDSYEEHKTYRVTSKILKLEENNQHGFAMTKAMPTGCIKITQTLVGEHLIFY